MNKRVSVADFDIHLEKYLKVTGKRFTLAIFKQEFDRCIDPGRIEYAEVYNHFKMKSKHCHKVEQLILV